MGQMRIEMSEVRREAKSVSSVCRYIIEMDFISGGFHLCVKACESFTNLS